MGNMKGLLPAAGQQGFSSSATQYHDLGARIQDRFGRVFRYCQAGAVALVAGNVIQHPASIADHINAAVTATAVGATTIAVTPGATAGAANLYKDGLAIISTTPGGGIAYPIKGHSAISASTEFTLRLHDDWPIQVALTTSSKVDLVHNPYSGVIQAPVTTLTGAVVGVAIHPIAISEYGWLQTWGPGAVLIDGTPAVGMALSSPAAVAGAAAINSSTLQMVGVAMRVGVDTKWKAVFITIAA